MIKQDISENQVNISYLSIGSNLGNKKRNIEKAKYLLEKNQVKIIKTSSIYETFSWPNKNHPKFYNVVVKITTNLKPIKLFFIIKNELNVTIPRVNININKIFSERVRFIFFIIII